MVRQGLSSKIESFCCGASCGYFAWLHGVVSSICGCLAMKKFAVNEFWERNFHSACNFDIIMLNNKILLESEQNLKFLKQITEHFWQEIVKFYKFKPHLNFSYQILLPHKTKAVKSFAKKHFKAIKTTRIFTRKTKFHLLNLTSYYQSTRINTTNIEFTQKKLSFLL